MIPTERRLISIVVPVYNEELNLERLYERVIEVMSKVADKYDFELVITDNHSTDRTFEKARALSNVDSRVRVIRFSKNFGYQRSILTGYINAVGIVAVQLDCDLQDPPEMILDFISKWEEGFDVVYGVRRGRREGLGITLLRKLFYRMICWLSEDPIPLDAGDFRLISRRVLDELAKFDDQQPYLRGAIASMGFNQIGIPYERDERKFGESKFSFSQLVRLAVDGILNHSIIPLRLATFIGLSVFILNLFGMGGYIVARIWLGKTWPAGFTTLVVLVLTSISLNALFLGIVGEYIGRIYQQVKKRPITIIEASIGKGGSQPASSVKPNLHPIPKIIDRTNEPE